MIDAVTCGIFKDPPWNLLYSGDTFSTTPTRQELGDDVRRWKNLLQKNGLRLNVKKTKYMELSSQTDGSATICLAELFRKVTCFKYLKTRIVMDLQIFKEGSLSSCFSEWGSERDISERVKRWNWRNFVGVLCDQESAETEIKNQLHANPFHCSV